MLLLHPKFKLKFLSEDARLHMKQQVLTYVQEVSDENHDYRDPVSVSGEGHSTSMPASANVDEDDLYSFMSSIGQNGAASSMSSTLSTEMEDFLETKSTSIQSLAAYPVIGRSFIKVISTLPSSAASSVLEE